MFTFAEKLKQMSNIEHKDVGVSSLKGTPSKKIYIKTSTEAVYNPEGVTQEYINNHVDGSKIVNGTITTNKIANGVVNILVTKQVSPDPRVSYMLRPRVKTLFGETTALQVFIKRPGTPYGPVTGELNEYFFAFTTPSFPAMTLSVSTGEIPISWTSGLETEALTHYEVRIIYDEMKEMYFGEIKSWPVRNDSSMSGDGGMNDSGLGDGGMDNIGG